MSEVFLTEVEWTVLMRYIPVRYIKGVKHTNNCFVCGLPGTNDNPLQFSHRVPFIKGVRKYKLRPEWLNSPDNIVSAHRKKCNDAAECTDEEIDVLIESLR